MCERNSADIAEFLIDWIESRVERSTPERQHTL
jgi:hypothetical protein